LLANLRDSSNVPRERRRLLVDPELSFVRFIVKMIKQLLPDRKVGSEYVVDVAQAAVWPEVFAYSYQIVGSQITVPPLCCRGLIV
jgi:hypothetical protein